MATTSDSISVKINCFHSGVFKAEDGKLNYVDGLLEQFEVNGDAAYEEVRKIIVKIVRVGRMCDGVVVDAVTGNEPVDGEELDVEQQDDSSDGDHGDHEGGESEDEKRRRLNMEQAAQEQAIEDVSSTAPPATQA
ncbi:hypothetical protein F2Q70_00035187 [Brassica cretica]|uniref:Uncharacterized protein n=1 Tax=Brassica cretica TaxID=69181 RepID=A0A8S9JUJ7_BRACR|nr:hypothetical protein F2Q70_00035187 [Brassica cretica]